MKRVVGLGGIFIKCQDVEKMNNWYRTHLGIDLQQWGAMLHHRDDPRTAEAYSVFSFFKSDSKYFDPSPAQFMVNFRVENLDALVEKLREEGVELSGEPQGGEYGKFAWVIDPEGNKVELWEQP